MALVSNHKNIAVFSRGPGRQMIFAEYDFTIDGGAQGNFDLFTVKNDLIILGGFFHVKVAVTSAGAPTLIVGVVAGDVDAFLASTLKGALTLDAVLDMNAAGVNSRIAEDGIVRATIGTADYTAGKILMGMDVIKADQ